MYFTIGAHVTESADKVSFLERADSKSLTYRDLRMVGPK